jgi:hypothetical protein
MVLLVVFGAAGSLAWMTLLPFLFTRAVRDRTGFDAEITSLAANPFTGRVSLRGLVMTNPPNFPTLDCLQVRSFDADADFWSLFGARVVISTLSIDVRQITLVRRAYGPTNLESFRANLAGPGPRLPSAKSPFLIRELRLRLDTLVLADFSEAKPRVRTFALGLDQRFGSISNLGQLLGPEILGGLAEREVAVELAPFLTPDLRNVLNEAAMGKAGLRKATEGKTGEVFRGFLDRLEETRKP